MIMAPSQRRCASCDAFLPNLSYDPHPLCARCRGGKCSLSGKKCDFCRNWSDEIWRALKPIARPYASRNPKTRSKKPSKASIVSEPNEVNVISKTFSVPKTNASVSKETVKCTSISSAQTLSDVTISNTFVGFKDVVSPSKPRLALLNAPLLVSDYKSP